MKKIISLVLALIAVLVIPLNCFAAADFVQSITYKPAPELVFIEDEDGKKIIGHVRDEEGNIISTEHEDCADEDCIIVTPVSEAETSTEIPEDAKKSLLEQYDILKDPDTKLSDICDGLDDKIKNDTDNKYGADDMVIRDLFDISEVCDNIKTHLPKDGYTLDLTFDLGIGKDEYITAMVFVDGKWTPIKKLVNNGDGTVTGYFESLGHVAFLVPSDSPSNVPATGDTSVQNDIFLWVGIMAASVCALVVIVFITRRKKADEE